MLEDWTKKLIAFYRQDLQDYEELLKGMQEYRACLETQNLHQQNRTEIDHIKNFQTREMPNTEPQQSGDGFEQALTQFSVFREEMYQRLRNRAEHTKKIQRLISDQTASAFEAAALQPYLGETLLKELADLTDRVKSKMSAVLEMDALIIPKLKMELESVKLELHRLQGAQKTKNAYQNSSSREARFIDKSK